MTTTAQSPIAVGDRIRFQHPLSNGGVATYAARVVKVEDDRVWVEVPKRVRRLPFPPAAGKRFACYALTTVANSIMR